MWSPGSCGRIKIMVGEFIKELKKSRTFGPQIASYRYIPPKGPVYGRLSLDNRLRELLSRRGIKRFWSHQVKGIGHIRRGKNVVIMTPTASGKSLVYNIPVVETILKEPDTHALYIFPLKGLEQDQVKNLNDLLTALGIGQRARRGVLNPAEIYDGDTTAYRRKRIRERLPYIIFTNPDMLHLAINAFHTKWEGFFRTLRYVIIDEIHAYRGVFGSNVAQILRRLRRICTRWGSNPQFIASSATIANPGELAQRLVGLPFEAVTESGAPQGGRHFLFVNPLESPYTLAMRLFVEAIRAGLKTIVFTKARKITELIYAWCVKSAPAITGRISPYRAGFLPAERREIERRLFSGELSGVISTSALELGIDVGGLDCCILVGYPGSISSTWQRAGRVGRHGEESLVVLIALQDALDQYIIRHPERLFQKAFESAIVDPDNEVILKKHLPCAASEVYLREDDSVYSMERIKHIVDELLEEGALRQGRKGGIWFSGLRMPQRGVEIRGIGALFRIVDEKGNPIGELDGMRVYREGYPGAVYLHRGRQYKVEELVIESRRIIAREVDVQYYTQALTTERTEILSEKTSKAIGEFEICSGGLRISQRVVGYEKRNIYDRRRLSRHALDLPEYVFDTEGLWIVIPDYVSGLLEERGYDLAGSLHAAEHASISAMPLYVLCEKMDVGGLSYSFYPALKKACIFIYDGYEGGVGYTSHLFDLAREWLQTTLRIISECRCESGCPSCVQDPQCGSGNQPLDKEGAKFLLEHISSRLR
ncbi:MAG TPA: DEAD/DEAH box helicase [Nitrospirae bacterium]|nr:DEAD/DEAH box helicase [Nitrospirota bacterium]